MPLWGDCNVIKGYTCLDLTWRPRHVTEKMDLGGRGGGYFRSPKRYSKTISDREKDYNHVPSSVWQKEWRRWCWISQRASCIQTRDCIRQLQIILVSRLAFFLSLFSFAWRETVLSGSTPCREGMQALSGARNPHLKMDRGYVNWQRPVEIWILCQKILVHN